MRPFTTGDEELDAAIAAAGDAQPGAAVTITPYRNGPYVVRGDFVLVGQDGREIDTGRRTVALCRCGKSRARPLCDGTHKAIGFKAAGAAEGDALRPLPVDRAT